MLKNQTIRRRDGPANRASPHHGRLEHQLVTSFVSGARTVTPICSVITFTRTTLLSSNAVVLTHSSSRSTHPCSFRRRHRTTTGRHHDQHDDYDDADDDNDDLDYRHGYDGLNGLKERSANAERGRSPTGHVGDVRTPVDDSRHRSPTPPLIAKAATDRQRRRRNRRRRRRFVRSRYAVDPFGRGHDNPGVARSSALRSDGDRPENSADLQVGANECS